MSIDYQSHDISNPTTPYTNPELVKLVNKVRSQELYPSLLAPTTPEGLPITTARELQAFYDGQLEKASPYQYKLTSLYPEKLEVTGTPHHEERRGKRDKNGWRKPEIPFWAKVNNKNGRQLRRTSKHRGATPESQEKPFELTREWRNHIPQPSGGYTPLILSTLGSDTGRLVGYGLSSLGVSSIASAPMQPANAIADLSHKLSFACWDFYRDDVGRVLNAANPAPITSKPASIIHELSEDKAAAQAKDVTPFLKRMFNKLKAGQRRLAAVLRERSGGLDGVKPVLAGVNFSSEEKYEEERIVLEVPSEVSGLRSDVQANKDRTAVFPAPKASPEASVTGPVAHFDTIHQSFNDLYPTGNETIDERLEQVTSFITLLATEANNIDTKLPQSLEILTSSLQDFIDTNLDQLGEGNIQTGAVDQLINDFYELIIEIDLGSFENVDNPSVEEMSQHLGFMGIKSLAYFLKDGVSENIIIFRQDLDAVQRNLSTAKALQANGNFLKAEVLIEGVKKDIYKDGEGLSYRWHYEIKINRPANDVERLQQLKIELIWLQSQANLLKTTPPEITGIIHNRIQDLDDAIDTALSDDSDAAPLVSDSLEIWKTIQIIDTFFSIANDQSTVNGLKGKVYDDPAANPKDTLTKKINDVLAAMQAAMSEIKSNFKDGDLQKLFDLWGAIQHWKPISSEATKDITKAEAEKMSDLTTEAEGIPNDLNALLTTLQSDLYTTYVTDFGTVEQDILDLIETITNSLDLQKPDYIKYSKALKNAIDDWKIDLTERTNAVDALEQQGIDNAKAIATEIVSTATDIDTELDGLVGTLKEALQLTVTYILVDLAENVDFDTMSLAELHDFIIAAGMTSEELNTALEEVIAKQPDIPVDSGGGGGGETGDNTAPTIENAQPVANSVEGNSGTIQIMTFLVTEAGDTLNVETGSMKLRNTTDGEDGGTVVGLESKTKIDDDTWEIKVKVLTNGITGFPPKDIELQSTSADAITDGNNQLETDINTLSKGSTHP